LVKLGETDQNSFFVENLAPGTVYKYRLLARNDCGLGEMSPDIVF
jgi:hypothetical protein